jgi:two-component system chemotaxis response regulator CheB
VDGAPIQRGHTYVAPGDFHLYVDKQGARLVTGLNQAPPEHYCRPSVNPLFESAAQWYGRGVLAVMLTGMGEDGIEGTRKVVELGGTVIAQDQASSVVWGMPAAVVREELADQVLPLDCVAAGILRLCHQEVACG